VVEARTLAAQENLVNFISAKYVQKHSSNQLNSRFMKGLTQEKSPILVQSVANLLINQEC
jgi:hypothetical protein